MKMHHVSGDNYTIFTGECAKKPLGVQVLLGSFSDEVKVTEDPLD